MVPSLIRFLAVLVATVTSEDGATSGAEEPQCDAAKSEAPKENCGCSNLNRGSDDSGDATEPVSMSTIEVSSSQLSAAAMRHNEEMVEVPSGQFFMGEPKERVYFKQDGEGPLRFVRMSGFRLDKYEVSNSKFQDFVSETGYVTDAERYGNSFVAELFLSQAVSDTIDKKVEAVPWWLLVNNATWRTPEGIDSGLEPPASRFGNRWTHPVVHMSWTDADAYCRWRNATLPTEAQWEYAARGGEKGKRYPWGDEMYGEPKKHRMNIWQGTFPTNNTGKDGFPKTAPTDAYEPQNKFGLHNLVGNVWEWVSDWWSPVHFLTEANQHTGLIDPPGPTVEELEYIEEQGYLKRDAGGQFEKVKKGGSFMCHKSYCWRYRTCARSKMTVDSTAHHIGMRCARPAADPDAAHWSKAPENSETLSTNAAQANSV